MERAAIVEETDRHAAGRPPEDDLTLLALEAEKAGPVTRQKA